MASSKLAVGWRSTKTVTVPFTAEHDGIMIMNLNPASSAAAYYYVSDGYMTYNLSASGGARAQSTVPLIKGRNYTLNASGNVGSITLTAYYL